MQRESKGIAEGVRRREEEQRKRRKKKTQNLASKLPEFIQFIPTTTQKVKSANSLQGNATQSSALKIPFLGNSRKRRKSRNMATLSFRLPDLWLFGTGAGRAEEILDYPTFYKRPGSRQSTTAAVQLLERRNANFCSNSKKNITDMIQDFFSPQKQLQILRKENKRLECISALHLIPTHTTHQDTGALSNLI